MRRRASILAALGVACGVIALEVACAQPGRPGPGPEADSVRIERTVSRLKQELALTEQQEAQVRPVVARHIRAMRQEMQSSSVDLESMRALRSKHLEKMDSEIESLLTDEQRKAFDRYREGRRQHRRDRVGPPPGDG